MQYQTWLKANGVSADQIVSVNFEELEYEELLDYRKLYEYLKNHLCVGKKTYIFLDEIQKVTAFEKVVDSLYVKPDIDIYITGSNAYMLSSDLATLLTGRYVEIKMLPLSFKEFLDITALDAEQGLAEYLRDGGLPYIAVMNRTSEKVETYLEGIYNITKTSIDFELDSAGYNYKIEYSIDGNNYQTFVDKLSQSTETRKVIDSGNINARYLKFTVNNNEWGASIWEIQVKGAPVNNWSILSAIFKSGTNVAGGEGNLTVKITEHNNVVDANVYCAIYNSDGVLQSTALSSAPEFSDSETDRVVCKVKMPEEKGTYLLKVFSWTSTQTPVSNVYSKSITVK